MVTDLLAQIQDVADQLTEPRQHRERIEFWRNRNRKVRVHVTFQPSLLAQLADCVVPAGTVAEGALGAAFRSKPPLQVEALSRFSSIAAGAMEWCTAHRVGLAVRVDTNVRKLVGVAATLDVVDQRRLLADLMRWRSWCLVVTGWEKVITPHRATCPACSARGTLAVNLTTESAMCRACARTWSTAEGTLGLLARHLDSVAV